MSDETLWKLLRKLNDHVSVELGAYSLTPGMGYYELTAGNKTFAGPSIGEALQQAIDHWIKT